MNDDAFKEKNTLITLNKNQEEEEEVIDSEYSNNTIPLCGLYGQNSTSLEQIIYCPEQANSSFILNENNMNDTNHTLCYNLIKDSYPLNITESSCDIDDLICEHYWLYNCSNYCYNITTEIQSCNCPIDFYGEYCQYHEAIQCDTKIKHNEYFKAYTSSSKPIDQNSILANSVTTLLNINEISQEIIPLQFSFFVIIVLMLNKNVLANFDYDLYLNDTSSSFLALTTLSSLTNLRIRINNFHTFSKSLIYHQYFNYTQHNQIITINMNLSDIDHTFYTGGRLHLQTNVENMDGINNIHQYHFIEIENYFGYLGLFGIFFLIIYSYITNAFIPHSKLHNFSILFLAFLFFITNLLISKTNFKKQILLFFITSIILLFLF